MRLCWLDATPHVPSLKGSAKVHAKRGHTGPVPMSRTNAAPRADKEPGTHRNMAHF